MATIIPFPLPQNEMEEKKHYQKKIAKNKISCIKDLEAKGNMLDLKLRRSMNSLVPREDDFRGVQVCPLCTTVCVGAYCENNKCKHYWTKIPRDSKAK